LTILGLTDLNRATLDRQLLLRRSPLRPTEAIEHLVGLQAQAPLPPYTGLWTRLATFRPEDLAGLLVNRSVVRIALMRSTIHLVTADDCLALRPVVQAVLDRAVDGPYAPMLAGLDRAAAIAHARELLRERPREVGELARLLTERWGRDRNALINLVRAALPLVQMPPRGVWGAKGRSVVTTATAWLGRPLASDRSPDRLVLRYLGAFGPASVADVQKWSGLGRLAEVLDRLRPDLVTFRDPDGVELFDLPDAPRPGPGTPAPVRFLPEYDNLLIGYADARRVMAAERKPALFTINGIIRSAVLVDGFVAAVWKVAKTRGAATCEVRPLVRLTARVRAAIEKEGLRLLHFAAAEAATREVRILDA
jgi:hypothetical protein